MTNPAPPRPLPGLTPMNDYFWRGGADGCLHILQCSDCAHYIHPYAARCTACRSSNLSPQPVSGQGRVVGFTINYQPWVPDVPVPYVVALVQLDEQHDLRLMTNLPRCAPEDVYMDMSVQVYFEEQDGAYVPLFAPAGDATHA